MDVFFVSRIIVCGFREERPSISRRGGAVVNAQKADLLPEEDASAKRDMMLSYSVSEYAKCSFNEGDSNWKVPQRKKHVRVDVFFSLFSLVDKNERVVT